MAREPKVVDEDVVIDTLRSRGVTCSLTETKASWRVEFQGRKGFMPRGLTRGGYTQTQLDYIEYWCAHCGLDLMPLDRRLT